MSRQEIIHAYRKLYRSGLRAVQYSKPARYSLRTQLREAFREPGATFNAEGCRRTVWFLNAAAQETGIEHKIVRNLLRVAYMRRKPGQPWTTAQHKKSLPPDGVRGKEFEHYDLTVKMLNETMGLCLR